MGIMNEASIELENIAFSLNKLKNIFTEDTLRNLINIELKKAFDQLENCEICDELTNSKTKCCSKLLCNNCNEKVGKCPYCRTIFDEDKDNDISDEINDYVYSDFPDTDEMPELEEIPEISEIPEFTEKDKTVLSNIFDEINHLLDCGNIEIKERSKYIKFINPTTGKIYTGLESHKKLIDHILKNLSGNALSRFGDSFHYVVHRQQRRLLKMETSNCSHITVQGHNDLRQEFFNFLCEDYNYSDLLKKKLIDLLFSN